MPDVIDLRPLLVHAAAAEMLLLARGQLNRAFRAHGLIPPDPLPGSGSCPTNASELDDPAARGIEYATAWHGDAFVTWAEAMPRKLVRPVLDILRQTHQALGRQQEDDANGARAAVLRAYEFLLIPVPADQYAFAQSRIPIDMMVHGRPASLIHASEQWSTMSS